MCLFGNLKAPDNLLVPTWWSCSVKVAFMQIRQCSAILELVLAWHRDYALACSDHNTLQKQPQRVIFVALACILTTKIHVHVCFAVFTSISTLLNIRFRVRWMGLALVWSCSRSRLTGCSSLLSEPRCPVERTHFVSNTSLFQSLACNHERWERE